MLKNQATSYHLILHLSKFVVALGDSSMWSLWYIAPALELASYKTRNGTERNEMERNEMERNETKRNGKERQKGGL